jgi:hypothetical protein
VFYRLRSHLLRVESHHNGILRFSLPLTPFSSHPQSAARNYGANSTPFVPLQVASPRSLLCYTVISTASTSFEALPLLPVFKRIRDFSCGEVVHPCLLFYTRPVQTPFVVRDCNLCNFLRRQAYLLLCMSVKHGLSPQRKNTD